MTQGLRPTPHGWLLAIGAVAAALVSPGLAQAGELRGRVVSGGQGVAGASISAVAYETPFVAARREAHDGPSPSPLATTTTRNDGGFVLSLPASAPAVQLRIEASGSVAVRLIDVFDGTETAEVGDVELSRAALLTGRVVDGRGAPVADATVSLEPGLSAPGGRGRLPETRLLRTGTDGAFRFDAASPSGNRLRVEKGGLATVTLASVRAGGMARPVVLGPARGLVGSVRRPDGRTPAPGVFVRSQGHGLGLTRWVETAADGSFHIADAPAETDRVVAEGGPLGRGEATVTSASSEGRAPLTVVLDPPTRITGRIVNAKTLGPVPRTRVEAQAHGRVAVTRSGPDGHYALDALTPGTYRLVVDEPRFTRYVRPGVRLPRGKSATVDIPLTAGAILAGRVVDEQGRPVAGVVGRLSRGGRAGFGPRFGGRRGSDEIAFRTGADGTFRAERLSPGPNQRLTLAHPQYEPRVVAGLSLPSGRAPSGLTVVLRRGLEIAGVVRDSEGHPVAGVEVELRPSASERRGGGRFAFERGAIEQDSMRATSGPDGAFRIAGLESGAYALQARHDGYAAATLDPLRLESGVTPPTVDVWLLPGAVLSGFVHRPDGSGAKGFIVAARAEGAESRPFGAGLPEATGDDGAFTIDGLRAGETYTLVVFGRGGPPEPRDSVVAPARDVEILVGGVGRITGRVIDAQTRKPVTDFTATYEADLASGGFGRRMRGGAAARAARDSREDDEDDGASRSLDGTFAIQDVPPGTWTVTVDAEGYETARVGGVSVREGETAPDVEVQVRRGRVLGGRVIESQTGRPVPGVSVTASSAAATGPAGFGQAVALSDADGRFEITGLALGTYRLLAQHPDYAEASQIVDVEQTVASVAVRLSAGGTLGGVVVAESGEPVAGAEVALQTDGGGGPRFGGSGPSTASDGTGAFRFDRLAAGRYSVTASLGGRSSAPVDVALLSGQSREDVRIAIGGGTTLRGRVSGLGSDLRGSVNVTARGPGGYFAAVRPTVDGAFSLAGVPAGAVHLQATAGSFSTGSRSASADVTIADGQAEAEVDIVFVAGYTLSGTITLGGQAVAGALVSVSPAGQAPSGMARTDADGNYSVTGLNEGDYAVTVSPPRGASQRRTVHVSGDQSLDFTLPLAKIAGVVVEAGSGLPLAEAEVSVDVGGGPRGGARATTDSNGRFDLEGLEPRSYVLTTRLTSYAYEQRTVDASGEGGGDVTIELRRGEGLGVRARDGLLGVPLRGLFGEARDGAGVAVFAGRISLDSDGRGEVPSLRPGTYSVRLAAPGYAPTKVAVGVPSPTVDLAFTPGGTVEIRVGPETAAQGPQARLLDSSGSPYPVDPFSSDGWFALTAAGRRLEHVTPGSYTFVVVNGATKSLAVGEGDVSLVELP